MNFAKFFDLDFTWFLGDRLPLFRPDSFRPEPRAWLSKICPGPPVAPQGARLRPGRDRWLGWLFGK
jgi:hypothetical protein